MGSPTSNRALGDMASIFDEKGLFDDMSLDGSGFPAIPENPTLVFGFDKSTSWSLAEANTYAARLGGRLPHLVQAPTHPFDGPQADNWNMMRQDEMITEDFQRPRAASENQIRPKINGRYVCDYAGCGKEKNRECDIT